MNEAARTENAKALARALRSIALKARNDACTGTDVYNWQASNFLDNLAKDLLGILTLKEPWTTSISRKRLRNYYRPSTYRRLMAISTEPLWDGLPPSQYVTAMLNYQGHPHVKIFDKVIARIDDARKYVGTNGIYGSEWQAVIYAKNHPLDSQVRTECIEKIRCLLEDEEFEILKTPPDLNVLLHGELNTP